MIDRQRLIGSKRKYYRSTKICSERNRLTFARFHASDYQLDAGRREEGGRRDSTSIERCQLHERRQGELKKNERYRVRAGQQRCDRPGAGNKDRHGARRFQESLKY